jgi:TRAP-type C4-dicarboxylate transport system substrate-binding protein
MSALGANPQPLSFSELYPALRQGIYDAQENPIPVIYNNKLYEVQDYLSVTNHIYSGMCFVISEDVWQRMPANYQQIIKSAALSSADADRDSNRFQTENLMDELEKAGMKINEPDLAPFAEATASVISDNASIYGDLYKKLEDWQAKH